MTSRSENDIVTKAPIVVSLGNKEYDIAPLVIKEARAWRVKVVEVLASLPSLEDTADTPENFDAALKLLLVTMQDTVLDLFFEYAKELDREEIEGIATEDEVADAFSRVIEVAFPLARSLPEIRKRLFR